VFNYSGVSVQWDFDSVAVSKRINEVLKRSWRIGCFVVDPYEAVETRAREAKGEDLSGAIYERGHSRPTMWAHYAERDAGACLVFDKSQLDADIRSVSDSVFVDKVVYRHRRVVPRLGASDYLTLWMPHIEALGFGEALDRHIEDHAKELFFRKAADWQHEREYRWVVAGDHDADYFVPITRSLVAVAMGERFDPCYKGEVRRYAETHGISLANMLWQNGVPQPMGTHWRIVAGEAI